jgi:hypothetical protein
MEYHWSYVLKSGSHRDSIEGVFSDQALRKYVNSHIFKIPKKFTHAQIIEKLEMVGYDVEMVRVYEEI